MNMKKTIALVLTIAICATMALGGTLAYLTDTEEAVNVMTVGRVDIDLIEQQRTYDEQGNTNGLTNFVSGSQLLPIVGSAQNEKDQYGMPVAQNYVDKIVTVDNIGNTPAYVRVIVGVPAALEESLDAAGNNALHWNVGNRFNPNGEYDGNINPGYGDISWSGVGTTVVNGVEYNIYNFTYNTALTGKTSTEAAAFVGFYLDERLDWNDETGMYHLNGNEIDYDFSRGVVIPVMAQAVQANGFGSAEEAFAAAGLPEIPWSDEAGTSFGAPLMVGTAEELSEAFNHNEGFVMMSNNLDLEETVRLPGGGTLDGNGYSIFSNVEPDEAGYSVPTVFADNGTVQNIGVFGPGRAIGTRGSLNGSLWVRNVCTDSNDYAFHVGGGTDSNGVKHDLDVRESEFHGWVSFGTGFNSVLFENVKFWPNSDTSKDPAFNGIRAYNDATFRGCLFDGVTLDLDNTFANNGGEIILDNCFWGENWEPITADNLADLLVDDSEAANIVIY